MRCTHAFVPLFPQKTGKETACNLSNKQMACALDRAMCRSCLKLLEMVGGVGSKQLHCSVAVKKPGLFL